MKKTTQTPKNPQKKNPYRRISNTINSEQKKKYWRKKMIERFNKIFKTLINTYE